MDIGYDRQSRAFNFFEDDDRKSLLLFQFGENARHLEVRINFLLHSHYLIRLLRLDLS